MVKEFEIQGRICNLPSEMTEKEFWCKVVGFIENNGWSFGGGLDMEKISGCVSDTSPDMTVQEFEKAFLGFLEGNGWSFEGSISIYGQAGTAAVMAKQHLFGSMVEIDEANTHRWYADAEEWGCNCGDCRNFLALAHGRQLPAFVLEQLDKLGIPPEKATYVCHLYDDEKGHLYQFSYRITGNILSGETNILSEETATGAGRCCHETYPYGAPGFPEPHFDLEFWVTLPWVLDRPRTGPQKEGVSS